MNYVDIIGIGMGAQDLTSFHMKLIRECDLLIGGTRQLAMFPDYHGETIKITGDIKGLVLKIKSKRLSSKIAVLASGDPLFYGIGSTLTRYFPSEQLRIHPNISSLSAAFSKIGLPWQDAKIVSLHSRHLNPQDFSAVFAENKVFFLTSPSKGPDFIAKQLQTIGKSIFNLCVLESLGDPGREKITWFSSLEELFNASFSNPNVVILVRKKEHSKIPIGPKDVSHETSLGIPETAFHHTKGLITKAEIRVLSLAKLKLTRKDHVIWDIGSGSGSVGIEAASMVPDGQVFAIEKNPDRIKDIELNIKQFNRLNISSHKMTFPEGKDLLPAPDRVFIGGGGDGIKQVVQSAAQVLVPGGVIVINTVVMENMANAMDALTSLGMAPEFTHVQISRSCSIGNGNRLSPLNPVWIISGTKPLEGK